MPFHWFLIVGCVVPSSSPLWFCVRFKCWPYFSHPPSWRTRRNAKTGGRGGKARRRGYKPPHPCGDDGISSIVASETRRGFRGWLALAERVTGTSHFRRNCKLADVGCCVCNEINKMQFSACRCAYKINLSVTCAWRRKGFNS